jgi:hypothetical protein
MEEGEPPRFVELAQLRAAEAQIAELRGSLEFGVVECVDLERALAREVAGRAKDAEKHAAERAREREAGEEG